jgi:hypothetical protein
MHIDTDCSDTAESNLDANRFAIELQETLEYGDDLVEVLTEFHAQMADYESKSYAVLTVTGADTIAEAFVWRMGDESLLVVGWQDDDTVVIGVLPPGTQFTSVPYYDGEVVTLH